MRRAIAGLALAALALGALEIFALHLLQPLENRLLDAFVRSHAARLAPDPDIVLVDIDEKSLARMQDIAGRWPWPRAVHAELLEGLAAQGPRAVVFDILFSEADKFRPESDAAFVEAVRPHANVYFPLVRLDPRDDPKFPPIGQTAGALGLVARPGADPAARIALLPPLALPPALWRGGTINFLEDDDGVGRRYALRSVVAGWEIPSLPARLARDLGYSVPDADELLLHWRGGTHAYRRVSYSDLYEDFNRATRKRAQDEFRGRIIIVGTAATALQDLRVTPLASLYPGAAILATAIDNLKNDRSMSRAPASLPAAVAAALVAALLLAFQRNVQLLGIGAGLAAVSAGLLAAAYAGAGRLLLVPLLAPLALGWLFYVAAALAGYLHERRAREQAITLFSRFVNPHVVKELLERGGLQGAGQQREVTLLFSDIRGFTTLSETRPPGEVVALLNRYFSLQVEVIFRHGGSLDKFIGDAIMAFWGAPLDDAAHARNAVAAALDMADALRAFKREIGEIGHDFDVGIGVHSGPAVVGLIGSQQRREYTAIGDTVNLASRIEGITKEASCRILVSRDTMERCRDAFDFAPRGSYKVKGRSAEIELFEPGRKT